MAARRHVRSVTGLTAREQRNYARGLYNDARERRDYDESMLREARNQQNRVQEFWGHDSEQAERAAEGVRNATNMRDYSVEYEVLKKQDLDRLEQAYSRTPLGQIENASKNAINAVSNALESIKDITINVLNNVVDLVRKR